MYGKKPNLILGRQAGQSLVIGCKGELVTVKILEVDPIEGAKIGIRADKSVTVDRLERFVNRNPNVDVET